MSKSRQESGNKKQDENQAPMMRLFQRMPKPSAISEAHINSSITLREIAKLNNTSVNLYADVTAEQVQNLPSCVNHIIIHPGITKNIILNLPRKRALKVETKEGVSDDIKLALVSLEEPVPVMKPRFLKPIIDINPKKRKIETPVNDDGTPIFFENKKIRVEPKPNRKHARDDSNELEDIQQKLKKMRFNDDVVNEKMETDREPPVLSSSFVPSVNKPSPTFKRKREDEETNYTSQLFKKQRSKNQKQHAQKREREGEELVNSHPLKKPRIQKLKNVFILKEKPFFLDTSKSVMLR